MSMYMTMTYSPEGAMVGGATGEAVMEPATVVVVVGTTRLTVLGVLDRELVELGQTLSPLSERGSPELKFDPDRLTVEKAILNY